MDMQEKDRCDSLKSEEKKEYKDWLLSNPPPSVSQGAHISSTSCSSVPMDDPFSTGLWSLSTKSTDLDLCKNSHPVTVNSRFNVEWPPDSLSTGDAGILNHNLSHFPSDSAFIERAAKFSCFSTSDLGGMMNPFDLAQQHGACANASRENSGAQLVEAGKDDASLSFDHGSRNVSLVKEQKERRDESNQAIVAGDSSSKGIGAVKRKRPNEDMPLHQAKLNPQTSGNLELDNNSPDLTNFKPKGKQVKESNESSKDDFIHIRARRGQATNSHSLAERVRREKINERMKLLQDLVPGCSKVTGKAVMLDEIINYVQSLQQQVEFLSMKLAAINPRLDIDIDTVLSKYLLSSNNGPSVATGFSSNLVHPQLHLSQQGLVQTGLSCIVNPPDILRRPINAQLTAAQGYKEPKTQVPNGWDEEFHNVMQMTSSNDMNLNSHRLQ